MGKIVLTCVLALVFGFGGAAVAVSAFGGNASAATQGATGLTGAPGPRGAPGQDGLDGARGARGPRGPAGTSAKASSLDLGSSSCAGKAMTVVTNVTIDSSHTMHLTKQNVCVVK